MEHKTFFCLFSILRLVLHKKVLHGLLVLQLKAGWMLQRMRHKQSIPEPEFLNLYRAQELIPRNQFRQPM
jgi:hypothetical protein